MSPATADQVILRLPKYRVIVCRQCQYAVRPNGVIKHLAQTRHRISAPDARQIQEAVQEWEGIEADVQQLQLHTRSRTV
jgi:predicted metal-binding protein